MFVWQNFYDPLKRVQTAILLAILTAIHPNCRWQIRKMPSERKIRDSPEKCIVKSLLVGHLKDGQVKHASIENQVL